MRRIPRSVGLLGVVGLVAGLGLRPAAAQQPKAAVLAAAQAVFDAMAARDTAALGRALHPAAHLIAAVERGDSVVTSVVDRAQFIARIGSSPTILLERMWNAEVRISGTIASVWTEYDFHVDGRFSHCGIDAFQLVRTAAGWRVTSIIYTVVEPAARCKPNPLGPPR